MKSQVPSSSAFLGICRILAEINLIFSCLSGWQQGSQFQLLFTISPQTHKHLFLRHGTDQRADNPDTVLSELLSPARGDIPKGKILTGLESLHKNSSTFSLILRTKWNEGNVLEVRKEGARSQVRKLEQKVWVQARGPPEKHEQLVTLKAEVTEYPVRHG